MMLCPDMFCPLLSLPYHAILLLRWDAPDSSLRSSRGPELAPMGEKREHASVLTDDQQAAAREHDMRASKILALEHALANDIRSGSFPSGFYYSHAKVKPVHDTQETLTA